MTCYARERLIIDLFREYEGRDVNQTSDREKAINAASCAETWVSDLPTASLFFAYVIENVKVKGIQYKGSRISAFIFIKDTVLNATDSHTVSSALSLTFFSQQIFFILCCLCMLVDIGECGAEWEELCLCGSIVVVLLAEIKFVQQYHFPGGFRQIFFLKQKCELVSSLLLLIAWVNYHVSSVVSTRTENDGSVVNSKDHVLSCANCPYYPETKS